MAAREPASLFRRVFLIRFDSHIYLSSRLDRYVFALLVLQSVFDTKLTIEFLSPFNADLCFLRFAWVYWLDDFLDGSR